MVTSAKISRDAAVADIDSLVTLIEQVEVEPYAHLEKEGFYKAVADAKSALPADSVTQAQMFLTLSRLTAMFRQGHLSISNFYKILGKDCAVFPFGNIMRIEPGTHKATITIDTVVQNVRVNDGMEICSVNGTKMKKLVDTYLQHVSMETDAFGCQSLSKWFEFAMWCYNPEVTEFDVELAAGGKVEKHHFKGVPTGELISAKRRKVKPYSDELINDSVMLFSFNSCQWNYQFQRFLREMFSNANAGGVKHLIIDVRENGGGNSIAGDEVCRYLTDRPFSGFGGSKAKISKSVADRYGKDMQIKYTKDTIFDETGRNDEYDMSLPYDAKFRFQGKTYLLIGPATFSSAANFAWEYWKFVPGTIIGEETGGVNICTGDILGFQLPNSQLKVIIPWKVFYQYGAKDGDPIHGTIPDIQAPSRDALKRAMELITTGK